MVHSDLLFSETPRHCVVRAPSTCRLLFAVSFASPPPRFLPQPFLRPLFYANAQILFCRISWSSRTIFQHRPIRGRSNPVKLRNARQVLSSQILCSKQLNRANCPLSRAGLAKVLVSRDLTTRCPTSRSVTTHPTPSHNNMACSVDTIVPRETKLCAPQTPRTYTLR